MLLMDTDVDHALLAGQEMVAVETVEWQGLVALQDHVSKESPAQIQQMVINVDHVPKVMKEMALIVETSMR